MTKIRWPWVRRARADQTADELLVRAVETAESLLAEVERLSEANRIIITSSRGISECHRLILERERERISVLREALGDIAHGAPWGGPAADHVKWIRGRAGDALTETESEASTDQPEQHPVEGE